MSITNMFQFIQESPSAFHAIESSKKILLQDGFSELRETQSWNLERGGKYFVTRNDSSLIAFVLPMDPFKGFHIIASHSDSPSFKLKENAEMTVENCYVKLNVERYGGMIMSTWFDRPLSIAGRVFVKQGNDLISKLVHIEEDLLIIPNLAIHQNRDANDGMKYNAQLDVCPLVSTNVSKDMILSYVAKNLNVSIEDILGQDLFLYVREEGKIVGMEQDFILCPRLDDLACAYLSLEALLDSSAKDYVTMSFILDNEEVGSGTKQGADSDFIKNTLKRITYNLGGNEENYMQAVANSFMVSADNGHALHPNYTAKADPTNRPALNKGIVLKFAANQKYTTDAYSASVIKKICMDSNVPYQTFFNRSDTMGGSTLGNIVTSQVSVAAADIGLPQFAMHSAVESAGALDISFMKTFMTEFYNS